MARMTTGLTAELLLRAYAAASFPMADAARRSRALLVDPEQRGILPLDRFHLPRRLARTVRPERFEIACDRAFAGVMRGCAEPRPDGRRPGSMTRSSRLYGALYERGHAHSVEAYRDGELVGGLYGVVARRRVLRREHVQPRTRRQQGRARRIWSRG